MIRNNIVEATISVPEPIRLEMMTSWGVGERGGEGKENHKNMIRNNISAPEPIRLKKTTWGSSGVTGVEMCNSSGCGKCLAAAERVVG